MPAEAEKILSVDEDSVAQPNMLTSELAGQSYNKPARRKARLTHLPGEVATQRDRLGDDICSFDSDRRELFVEVKTTSFGERTPFLVSAKAEPMKRLPPTIGTLDVTRWVVRFTDQMRAACVAASAVINLSLAKAMFWAKHRAKDLSPRQRKVINVLLDAGPGGFIGGMSTRKYESLTGTSRATASRELLELAALGLLQQAGAGRETRYDLQVEGE